nr:uncharacterized protein LOC123762699 isoform X2 [Procambarus clarkii]
MDNSAPLTLWLLVNKHGATAEGEKNIGAKRLVSVPMWPQWSAREVQAALLEALHKGHIVPSCAHNIVRVRDAQGALVPLTPTTLKSTPVQPLLLDLCTAHHNGSDGGQDDTPSLPPSFRKTVQDILARFERQLSRVEAGVGGVQARRAALVEAELHSIQDTLAFMSRRLDLTPAPDWLTGAQI